MKLAALLVLVTACAPVPASLPWVRIDRALEGSVCSREAAQAIVQRRAEERAEWKKQLIDCGERVDIAEAKAARAQWWERNAPWLIAVTGSLGIAVGGAVGIAIVRN